MTAKLFAKPSNILDENFDPESMHPADLCQIIEAAYDEYEALPKFTKIKKQYRIAYNKLVDILTEKRQFAQFSHL